ncbi:hypothetical protein OBP_080 [Pseudomonas phage OBP]|uniref:hypothetical protein n=1 Tax=Pseudomonas phage OBP TaxID=1124849 RepID=UPI000240D42E|nr:hypothetical protein OBP_080 [Pseudomonas phage OBP]AEV89517.1 hypothetical protein OBP_080 [Pseudomonas phage OBP]
MEYKIHEIVRHAKENQVQINYIWHPARPVAPKGLYGLKIRIKGALKVLTGKADTVVWPGNQ